MAWSSHPWMDRARASVQIMAMRWLMAPEDSLGICPGRAESVRRVGLKLVICASEPLSGQVGVAGILNRIPFCGWTTAACCAATASQSRPGRCWPRRFGWPRPSKSAGWPGWPTPSYAWRRPTSREQTAQENRVAALTAAGASNLPDRPPAVGVGQHSQDASGADLPQAGRPLPARAHHDQCPRRRQSILAPPTFPARPAPAAKD